MILETEIMIHEMKMKIETEMSFRDDHDDDG